MTYLERREFLAVALSLWKAASLRAHQGLGTDPRSSAKYKDFVFFDERRRGILRRLMDRIVPPDERSAGAVGAEVDKYIDFVLAHADPVLQKAWREGLDRFGLAIGSKEGPDVDAFLSKQAGGEFSPRTENERFFVYLKTAVAEGFYTSREGIEEELGYKGMTFEMDFLGCTHPKHTVPSGYKPLLRALEKA
jgi:hypothetical protein